MIGSEELPTSERPTECVGERVSRPSAFLRECDCVVLRVLRQAVDFTRFPLEAIK